MKPTIVAALAALTLAGCGEARQDATKSGQKVDRGPAEVIAMPDQFRNVAHKCDGHGHRVYSTTRVAPPVVVDDPTCAVAR